MDTYTEQPAPASNFYGTQKQPRLKLDTKRRTPTSGIPSSSNRSPFSPFTGHNSFLKRQHSPIRSYGMSHALRDVKNTGDHVRPVRTGTPHPEATRTWGQARRESLSVEKKLKSFSIESETRKSNASEDVFPIKNGIRHNYGRRSSAGQQSALVPRELFSSDIENQDPDKGRAANDKLVQLEEIENRDSQSDSTAPDVIVMPPDETDVFSATQRSFKSVKSPIPLTNLKNSCYMNSVVQSLTAFPDFILSLQKYLNSEANAAPNADVTPGEPTADSTSSPVVDATSSRFPIIKSLVKLFLDYEAERRRAGHEEKTADIRLRLERLKQKVGDQSKQFLSDNQQDAGEFFSFLVDAASDEFKKAKTPNLIDDWMALTTETRMTCCSCKHVSDPVITPSTSTYLAVPEPQPDGGAELNLQKLFNSASQEVERREYPCPRDGCEGREMDATRTMTKLPQILVVQMSRISLAGEKIETPVEINHTLSIAQAGTVLEEDELMAVIDQRCVCYELKSVICHIGPSTTKGHYYSLTRNHVNGVWYDCDDHEIKRVDFDQVRADGRIYGYCFFYEKID